MGRDQDEHLGKRPLLYRRLQNEWWEKAKKKGTLHPIPLSFFMPRQADADGLSVSRAYISTIEIASTSARTGKRMCLAEFPTSVVTGRGLTVEPKETDHDPGHAIIPELNYVDRADPELEAVMEEHAEAIRMAARLAWEPDSPDV